MDIETAIELVAAPKGISANEAYAIIQEHIDASFDAPNPELQAAWRKVPFEGPRPTAKEVVLYYVTERAKEKATKPDCAHAGVRRRMRPRRRKAFTCTKDMMVGPPF